MMSATARQTTSNAAVPPSPTGGRRRAQLVQGGGPPVVESRISAADVQGLRADPTPKSRAALAAKLGRQYDDLIDGETRPLAESILQLMVKDVEQKVRQTLAEAIASSPNLPPGVVAQLARDDIEVARPVLERSPVLSDEELAEIVRTHAMQYAFAVAGRRHVSEWLSDVLADTGEAKVVARLAGNEGAEISEVTLQRIAEDYQSDRAVQQRLVRRPALPYELVDQLVGAIGERLEWELVRQRRMDLQEARHVVAAARERATLSIVAREHGERSVERELRQQYHAGELGPEEVLEFLRDGQITQVEAALGLLTDSDINHVRQLLYGMDKRGLAALCARAGFGTPHYVATRMALDLAEQGVKGTGKELAYPEETFRFVQKQYERIRNDAKQIAQWFPK